ncbi:MAG: hypothetical protein KDI63_07505 [Gammaproteobacteria bacterium]|nr:hypothetical protein [Gammaproteobacteria bacterium]
MRQGVAAFITYLASTWIWPCISYAEDFTAARIAVPGRFPANVLAEQVSLEYSGASNSGFQIKPLHGLTTYREFGSFTRQTPAAAGLPVDNNGESPLNDNLIQLIWLTRNDTGSGWGLGPQVSLRTEAPSRQSSPVSGAGLVGMAFGSNDRFAYGGIAGHHWGGDSYSMTTLQPIVFYNIDASPGAYVGYRNTISYRWNANSGDRWQIPLGLTLGRSISLGNNGQTLDVSLGGYGVLDRLEGAPDWQLKFGVSLFFP